MKSRKVRNAQKSHFTLNRFQVLPKYVRTTEGPKPRSNDEHTLVHLNGAGDDLGWYLGGITIAFPVNQ